MPKPELDIDLDDEQKKWQGAFKRPVPAAPQQNDAGFGIKPKAQLQTPQDLQQTPARNALTAQGAAGIIAARQPPAQLQTVQDQSAQQGQSNNPAVATTTARAPIPPQAAQTLQGGAQSTGRFANFAQYFNANAGASANIANRMAAQAQQQAQNAQNAVRVGRADFYNDVARDTAAGRITERDGFGSDALAQQVRDAQGNVVGITNDDSREVLLKQQYGGANALDSALVGGQGRERFDALKKQFGGMGEAYDKDAATAKTFSDEQKKARAGTIADEQRLHEQRAELDERGAAEEADKNPKLEVVPKPNWKTYSKGNVPAHLSGTYGIKSDPDVELRGMFVNWAGGQGEKVFNDLSDEEYSRLLKMPKEEALNYIMVRATEIDTWGPRKGR